MTLQWKEPPERRAGSYVNWAGIAAALQSRPGDWAIVREDVSRSNATMIIYKIRTGGYRGMTPAGAFDARTTASVDARGDVYARYVGKVDE